MQELSKRPQPTEERKSVFITVFVTWEKVKSVNNKLSKSATERLSPDALTGTKRKHGRNVAVVTWKLGKS